MNSELYRKGDRVDIKKLKGAVLRSGLTTVVKKDYLDYIASDSKTCVKTLRILMYDLFNVEEAFRISQKHNDIHDWVRSVIVHLCPSISEYNKPQIDRAIALLIYEQSIRDTSYNDLLGKYAELLKLKGGVL